MAVVLVVALALILASIAAINRSGSGVLGSLFTTQSKEARETAESGLTEIIGTLNQRNNRGLLVSGVSPSSWGTVNNPVLQNPCNNKVDPTAAAAAIGATGTRPAGGEADQRYFLKSVSFTSVDGATGARSTRTFSRANSATATFSASNSPASPVFNSDDISLNGDRKGYFTLVVVGEVLRPGTTTVISSAEVRREFQVVPKCCGLSFGNTYANPAAPSPDHGLDQRPCPSGFGFNPLVVGADGDGTFNSNGNSLTLYRPDSSNPLPTIGTLNPSEDCSPASDCQISWGGNTTLLKPVNFELPTLPPPPTSVTKSGCISNSVTLPYSGLASTSSYAKADFPPSENCTTSTVTVTQDVYQFQGKAAVTKTKVGANWTTVYTCSSTSELGSTLPGGAITVNSSFQNITLDPNDCYSQTQRTQAQTIGDPYCAYNSSESRFDCLIRYIDGNISVRVDSTEAPVRVYMYDADGTSPAGGTVSFSGGGGIAHKQCATYSPSCSTDAALADASRFQMYGNIDDRNIDLRGNTNALAGFFYFPFADVELRGGGGTLNFSGILWTNNLTLRGGVEFSLPSIADTNTILCGVYPTFCDNDPTNDNIRPQYDFVARSVSSTSLFN